MNDRFKFRFFNEYSNKLESCDEYDLKDIFESGNPVMQCTGLKDKNGKLIYEGDIVKTKYTTPSGVDMEEICTVDFDRCAFWINYDSCAFYLDNENCIYEVIGNIYENKELLESEG